MFFISVYVRWLVANATQAVVKLFHGRVSKRLISPGMFLVALGTTFAVLSQPSAPEEKIPLMVRQVLRADGVLTKQKHAEFWSELNRLAKDDREEFLNVLRVGLIAGAEFQVALWDSVQISFQQGKVVKTGRLIEMETEARSRFLASLPANLPSKERGVLLRTYDDRYSIAIKNNARLLQAAATRQSLRVSEQETIEMDEENIRLMVDSVRRSFDRAMRILQPVWREETVPVSSGEVSASGAPARTRSIAVKPTEKTPAAGAVAPATPEFNPMTATPESLAGAYPSTSTLGQRPIPNVRFTGPDLLAAQATAGLIAATEERKRFQEAATFGARLDAANRETPLASSKLFGQGGDLGRVDYDFQLDLAKNWEKYEAGFEEHERKKLRGSINQKDYDLRVMEIMESRENNRIIEAHGAGQAMVVRFLAFVFSPLILALIVIGIIFVSIKQAKRKKSPLPQVNDEIPQ